MPRLPSLLGALAFFAAIGCGGPSAPVTGSVTYEGNPVEEGAITFLPTDGKEASRGAMIKGGRYAADMVPGKWTVQISGGRKLAAPASSEDAYKKGQLADKAGMVPPNALGNGGAIEIKPGPQTFDFALTKPGPKKS
ncbi:MAG: hypothetical protein K2X38_01325 [Gemmataceae bacterium]|nr:hypothetical protein [Gemmataceae bacterium]